jgi:hypothetical protein
MRVCTLRGFMYPTPILGTVKENKYVIAFHPLTRYALLQCGGNVVSMVLPLA